MIGQWIHTFIIVVIGAVLEINFSIFGWWPVPVNEWVHAHGRRMWTILTAGTRRFTCACMSTRRLLRVCVPTIDYGIYASVSVTITVRCSHCLSLSLFFHRRAAIHTHARNYSVLTRQYVSSIRTHGIYCSRTTMAVAFSHKRFPFLFFEWNIISLNDTMCACNFHCCRGTLYLRTTF